MAAVCGTSGIASLFSQAAFAADSDIADGQTQRFDFSILQSMSVCNNIKSSLCIIVGNHILV